MWHQTWFADIWTVLHKESRELMGALCACRAPLWMFALSALVMGGFLVWSAAMTPHNDLVPLVMALVVPILPTMVAVAESFAGEREHGTFESLMMTPLSPNALLAGKVLTVTLFGWLTASVALIIALLVANLLAIGEPLAASVGPNLGAILGLSFLGAAFTASAGSYMVGHIATIRQAYTRLAWALASGAVGISLVVLLADGLVPYISRAVMTATGLHMTPLALFGLVLLGTDAALYLMAALHFRRRPLITD